MTLINKYLCTLFVFAFSLHFVASGTASACNGSINVALASNGAVATASSAYDPGVCGSGAVAANDGDRTGRARCSNRVWNDAAPANTFPDWLQIDFNGSKTITEIDVVTVQDHLEWPVEPTESMTFSQYGLTVYQVQYWNNSTWVTIPGGTVSGNNKVWRKFTFAAITTTKIRVWATASADGYSRIVELEAWTGPSPESRYDLALGATATASTNFPGWGPSAVVNGDRKSLNAYSNGAWSNSAANNFPEWVQVDFGANKTIGEIHVFALQNNWANSVEPTPEMTFTLYGLTGYDVQYWTGTSWATVPGGNVTGNNKIWKTFTFSPISTSKIRVLSNAAPDGVSRVTEIEAYAPQETCGTIARLDPLNATGGGGENPLSQNFNWNLPLVSLPGRAGLDLGLSLSYNSLVWTKNTASSISFDDDKGFPSPGFRLGFPVIQQLHYNGETAKYGFVLLAPDGSRIELRQVGTSVFFEAADSSHLLLDTTDMTLRTTDGTQLSYELIGNQFNCTKIKDRNGNFISIQYVSGRLDKVIETLGRQIKFNYNGSGLLTSITQTWNQGQPSQAEYPWAKFEYTDTTIQTNFPNLAVYGPANNTSIKTLSKVTLPNDSHFDFSYTSWGQVWKVAYVASDNVNHVLNYHTYNLPGSPLQTTSAQSDCPRFTQRRDWAKYWNGDTDGTIASNEEAVTTFSGPVSDTWTMPGDSQPVSGKRTQITVPDGTVNKIYFVGTAGTATGWSRGLPVLVDTISGGVTQRRSVTTWTQNNTSVSYLLNPRVLETTVYDPAGNRARMQIVYQQFTFANGTSCWYPRDVFEYEANATTKLRTTRTNYNTNTAYSDRRILSLPTEKLLYQGDVNASTPVLMSKVEFVYDESVGFVSTEMPTVQHDSANYSSHFVGRANLTKVIRHNVSVSESTNTSTKYNRAGSVVSTKDASNHEIQISHADAFSDNTNRNTFAYPTAITDPDGFSSTAKFNFDFGAVTYTQKPSPNPPTAGPQQTFSYDNIGRLQQVTNLVNNAYTRFEYSSGSQLRIDTYQTIQSASVEARSFQITDGAGRVIAAARQHPGSSGGYSGKRLVYDVMGRVIKSSNPTETSASGTPFEWNTAGDDASAGWIYTEQTYDWNGRPLVTTNQDLTTRTASYSGCGCAGGSVVTLTDEGTIDPTDHVTPRKRQQKIYSDVLGRRVKTETLNWEGGSVYSATVNTYDARNQLTLVRRFVGAAPADLSDLSCPSGTCQKSELTYDGYGRLKTKHTPAQQVDPNNPASTDHVSWDYNSDDTIQKITDPRGTVSTFSYNNRHLVTGVSYSLLSGVPTTGPSGVAPTATKTFAYDAAGNRKTMTDGMGDVEYNYDQLSRLTSETRHFNDLSGSSTGGDYTLTYSYNVGNELTSITDPYGAQVNYNLDSVGRLSSVTGTGFFVSTFLSNIQYRAWGDPKSVLHGNGRTATSTYDARMRISSYELTIAPQDSLRLHNQYEYYADGRLKKMTDLDDHEPSIIGWPDTARHFSRTYDFDHVGRLKRAKGIKPNGVEEDRPFTQSYGYDAFNNLTSRSGKYYYQQPATSDSATITNNRRVGSDYAADGQEIHSPGPDFVRDWSYDAAGKMVQVKETVTATSQMSTYVTSYDGDGQQVREFLQESPTTSNSYMVRSTVLGGRVITRLNNVGNKGGTLIEVANRITPVTIGSGPSGEVGWNHIDPLGLSEGGDTKAVYDPMGNRVAWQPVPTGPSPLTYPRSSSSTGGLGSLFGSAQDRGCVLDDRPISCQELDRKIWLGVVNAVVRNGIHPREVPYIPYTVVEKWVADDDGEKLGEGEDDEDNNIIRINKNEDDRRGHYEYYLLPQKRIPFVRLPLLNHKKLLQDTLAYSDCNQFMSRLISKTSEVVAQPERNDPVSTDIMTLYGMVNAQARGGFRLNHEGDLYGYMGKGLEKLQQIGGGGGASWGSWAASNITIWIYEQKKAENANARDIARTPFEYAQRSLEELVHVAGQNRTYRESELNDAAGALEPGLNFVQAVRKHCIPREMW